MYIQYHITVLLMQYRVKHGACNVLCLPVEGAECTNQTPHGECGILSKFVCCIPFGQTKISQIGLSTLQ